MLFAESSGSFDFIIFLIVMALGVRQSCKMLKGNDTIRGVAKQGALSVLSRMIFKR